jgi:hypothetical protein
MVLDIGIPDLRDDSDPTRVPFSIGSVAFGDRLVAVDE